jgi:hypothetical protein
LEAHEAVPTQAADVTTRHRAAHSREERQRLQQQLRELARRHVEVTMELGTFK